MWVVYYWEHYEGNFGHTYFKTYESAKTFQEVMNKDGGISYNWEVEEITFHDEE